MAAKEMEKQKKKSSSVCRVFKNTAYAVMSNYHLMSTAISLKATGLLSKVLNLPDKWDYSVKGLASICKEKETAIETALDELKDTGYLCVTKLFPNQTENKKIGYRYHFFEYSEKDKTVHIKPTDFITIEKACGSNGSKVCRVTKNANYTVMSSFFLRSKNLSLKAIGLLCKVLSLPDNWDYSIDGLTAICKDGRTVIKSALRELETWGYLKKTRLKPNETESGRFEYFYDFYEISDKDVPQEETSALSTGDAKKTKAVSKKYARQGGCLQEAEIQEEEKQGVENLSIENRQQYNTKDKIQKNQICSDEISINQSLSCAENAVENVENTIYSQSEDWIDGLMADKAKAEAQVRENIDYASEVQDIPSPADDVQSITLKYKGDAESLAEIKDKALSLGATVLIDNAEGVITVDTYDNHKSELDSLAYTLGLLTITEYTSAIDKPLFTDEDVIADIQRDENSDVPFWETGLMTSCSKKALNSRVSEIVAEFYEDYCSGKATAVVEKEVKKPSLLERDPRIPGSTELPSGSSFRFTDFLFYWLDSVKASIAYTSYEGYIRNLRIVKNHFDENYPDLLLEELTALQIQKFYNDMYSEGKTGNTVKHYHANIHKALKYAVKMDMLMGNPADKVDLPKLEKYRANFYSKEEINHLLKVFEGDRLELVVNIAAYYGLRRSEIIGLKWDAIDFDKGTLTVCRKITSIFEDGHEQLRIDENLKTEASVRTLPLIPHIEKMLKKRMMLEMQYSQILKSDFDRTFDGFVCRDNTGAIITPEYVTRHFKMIIKKFNLRPLRFHDLRHSCASLLLASGVSMKAIQDWLGHSTFNVTIPVPNSNTKPVAVPTEIIMLFNSDLMRLHARDRYFSFFMTPKR